MLTELRRTHLITHQNPIPRLLAGWALSQYFWVTPDGKQTNDAICREELTRYWALGWLMLNLNGLVVITELGRREADCRGA